MLSITSKVMKLGNRRSYGDRRFINFWKTYILDEGGLVFCRIAQENDFSQIFSFVALFKARKKCRRRIFLLFVKKTTLAPYALKKDIFL